MLRFIEKTKSSNFTTIFANIEYVTSKTHYSFDPDSLEIGKLSFKEEAAGKLRVFAMVDIITQSLLKPLHDNLFEMFRKIPNDSTHDQDSAFELAQRLSVKYGKSFGFDLSSATDRLPRSSQISILNNLFGIGDE